MNRLPLPAYHILLALAHGERHGYAIMQDLRARIGGSVGPGTVYGTIKRLLEDGLIEEIDERSGGDDPRRRYYRITRSGRKLAMEESGRLADLLKHARAAGLVPKTT